MVANIISRQLRATIGTDEQDWSSSVVAFVVGRESLSSSGLLKLAGTLALQKDLTNPESIDGYSNPSRWKPGTPVKIQVRSGGSFIDHPFGDLFITRRPPRLRSNTNGIDLELGCRLAWHDGYEFDDDRTGVVLGQSESCDSVAARLLQAQEIPPAAISLGTWPYTLSWPSSKVGRVSFVRQAGEIAYSNNYRYLYSDLGVVRDGLASAAIGTPAVAITIGSNDRLWEPLGDPEPPVEEYKASGVGFTTDELPNGIQDVVITEDDPSNYHSSCSGSSTSQVKLVATTESYNVPTDTSADITYTTTISTEELRAVWAKGATSSPCGRTEWMVVTTTKRYPQTGPNAFRLTSVVETTEQREGSVLAEPGTGQFLQYRDTKVVTITYTYGADESVASITAQEEVAEIILDPETDDPWNLRIARLEETKWGEIAPGLWRQTVTIETARIAADSGTERFQSNIWARRSEVQRKVSSGGETQPPKAELWDGEATSTEQHYEGSATYTEPGGGSSRARKRLISVPYGFSDAQMSEIATVERDLAVGRYGSYEIELPITPTLLAAARQGLFQIAVSYQGTTYHYLADALSFAHLPNQASAMCTGIFLGVS